MIKETGGPAFSQVELEGTERAFPQVFERTMDDGTKATTVRYGMTLRDYFAAKAMQAIINDTSVNIGITKLEDDMHDAKMAYRYADAMLEAREQ